MHFRWKKQPSPNPDLVSSLQSQLGIDEVICQILVQRGIFDFESARKWFRPSLDDLHDPFLMSGMSEAVERIHVATEKGQRILIYGDYDVDGTSAVSLLYSFLSKHYDGLDTYIPDRYKEGYGVSLAGIDYADDNGMELIIALDCGIKAIDQVNYAREKNIDFIICDHHLPGEQLPEAVAILDPKQHHCEYPYDELSGCGIGFKLVQALCQRWGLPDEEWKSLLDLLAVSIAADIVPITGENRVLAFYGLKLINSAPRPGLRFLMEQASRKPSQFTIMDVVFQLAPRINAAGRISHGKLAVELLTDENPGQLELVSKVINDHNDQRKELDSSITSSALEMIATEERDHAFSTVVFDPNWHKGVIGIVASRLIERHYRPTIVFTESNGVLAGSARSVKGFNIYDALNECSDLLEQFGGHRYAAGMTLRSDRYRAFKERFEEVVRGSIKEEMLVPQIDVDAELEFAEITPRFYRILRQMAPFGPANMTPVFKSDLLVDTGYSRVVGSDGTHLKVQLRDRRSGISMDGIGFGMADKLSLLQSGKPVSAVYQLNENEYNGRTSLQLMLKDLKLTGEV